jgi:hypothetical protein
LKKCFSPAQPSLFHRLHHDTNVHACRYWLFMAASWVGFAGSMLMTLNLLVRMPVNSRHMRWPFAVAYSSLVLTFIVSQSRSYLSCSSGCSSSPSSAR